MSLGTGCRVNRPVSNEELRNQKAGAFTRLTRDFRHGFRASARSNVPLLGACDIYTWTNPGAFFG